VITNRGYETDQGTNGIEIHDSDEDNFLLMTRSLSTFQGLNGAIELQLAPQSRKQNESPSSKKPAMDIPRPSSFWDQCHPTFDQSE
jgi:hypothetical protein